MLFIFSDSLFTDTHTPSRQQKIDRSINYVLKSVWESNHLVYTTRQNLELLRSRLTDVDCLSVVVNLLSNYSLTNYSEIEYHVNLVETPQINRLNNLGQGEFLELSVDFIQSSNLTQKTKIIGEDLDDISFFDFITQKTSSNIINHCHYSFEPIHGGGNRLWQIFKTETQAKNRFVLTFPDTDKAYPSCEIGETLKKVEEINAPSDLLSKIISLGVHELENLVPLNNIQLINCPELNNEGIDFLNKVFDSEHSELLQFLDLKKGVTKKKILSDPDYFEFTQLLSVYSDVDIENIENLSNDEYILPYVGKIIKYLLKHKERTLTEPPNLTAFQEEIWTNISKHILYWCCCRNSESLNT